jgi:hypothetical protein
MKCLCGYQQEPNNQRILAAHVQDCMVDGPCKDVLPLPVIVWEEGGFSVVREAAEGQQTFDFGLVRHPIQEFDADGRLVVDEEETTVEPVVEEEVAASE